MLYREVIKLKEIGVSMSQEYVINILKNFLRPYYSWLIFLI